MEEGKKKEGFFKRLGKDLRLQVGFCVASVMVLFAVYFPIYISINKQQELQEIQRKPQEVDFTLYANIESSFTKNGKTNLTGWVVKKDAKMIDTVLVLKNDVEKMVKVKRVGDLEALAYSEYLEIDSTSRGFDFEGAIKLDDALCYEIWLYVSYKIQDGESPEIVTKKVNTNRYLYRGMVYTYNPIEYEEPQLADKDIQELINEGTLCGYNKENGTWVFLKDNMLFWILDTTITSNKTDDIYIYLHFNTANNNNLPQERQQYGFDNYDFIFRENEIRVNQDKRYKVASIEIPVEYPITFIGTGRYDVQENRNYWELSYMNSYREY